MKHTVNVSEELRGAVHAIMLPILSTSQVAPAIPEEIQRKIANLSEFIALARTHVERDGHNRGANGMPVTEGNTRLPQELCQIGRGSALHDGRLSVNENDYALVRRVAFDSLPPARISALKAIIDGKSPHSLGLPKATIDRALDDLGFAGVLNSGLLGAQLSAKAEELLVEAKVISRAILQSDPPNQLVPETSPR